MKYRRLVNILTAILILSLLLPQSSMAAIGASAAKGDYASTGPVSSAADPIVNLTDAKSDYNTVTSPVSAAADPIGNINAASGAPGSALKIGRASCRERV